MVDTPNYPPAILACRETCKEAQAARERAAEAVERVALVMGAAAQLCAESQALVLEYNRIQRTPQA